MFTHPALEKETSPQEIPMKPCVFYRQLLIRFGPVKGFKTIIVFFIILVNANAKIGITNDNNSSKILPEDTITEIISYTGGISLMINGITSAGDNYGIEGGDTSINKIYWYVNDKLVQTPTSFNDHRYTPNIIDTSLYFIKVLRHTKDSTWGFIGTDSASAVIKVKINGFSNTIFSVWVKRGSLDSMFLRILSRGNERVYRQSDCFFNVTPNTCHEPAILVLVENKTPGIDSITFFGNQTMNGYCPFLYEASTLGTPGVWMETFFPELTSSPSSGTNGIIFDTMFISCLVASHRNTDTLVVQSCHTSTNIVYLSDRSKKRGSPFIVRHRNQIGLLLNSGGHISLFDIRGRQLQLRTESGNASPANVYIFKIDDKTILTRGKLVCK